MNYRQDKPKISDCFRVSKGVIFQEYAVVLKEINSMLKRVVCAFTLVSFFLVSAPTLCS